MLNIHALLISFAAEEWLAVHLVHFDRTISGLFQNQATKMAWKRMRGNELLLKFVAWSLPTYA